MTAATGRVLESTDQAARRPVVGWGLTAIAILHVALTPVFYGEALRSIADSDVIASIESDPTLVDLRSAGFWYLSAGLGMLVLGLLTTWIERQAGTVPDFLGWALLGLAAWGLLLMPASGFWAVLLVGVLALWSSRRHRRAIP